MKGSLLLLSFALLMLGGCSHWSNVAGSYEVSSKNWQVTFPEGWRRHVPTANVTLVTKDGLDLDYVRISRISAGDELEFTKQKFGKQMLPQEAAELVVANLRADLSHANFKVVENVPDSLGGLPGFRLLVEWKTLDGLRKRDLVYGLFYDEHYYEIFYEAPTRFYYAQNLPDVEKMKDSFRLLRRG